MFSNQSGAKQLDLRAVFPCLTPIACVSLLDLIGSLHWHFFVVIGQSVFTRRQLYSQYSIPMFQVHYCFKCHSPWLFTFSFVLQEGTVVNFDSSSGAITIELSKESLKKTRGTCTLTCCCTLQVLNGCVLACFWQPKLAGQLKTNSSWLHLSNNVSSSWA